MDNILDIFKEIFKNIDLNNLLITLKNLIVIDWDKLSNLLKKFSSMFDPTTSLLQKIIDAVVGLFGK